MANFKDPSKLKLQKQFSLSRDIVRILHDIADEMGLPQSQVVEKALWQYHKQHEEIKHLKNTLLFTEEKE